MRHRHLDYPPSLSPADMGLAAIDDILDRGDLADWFPLRKAVTEDPWGQLANDILHLCRAHPMYGTSVLWPVFIAKLRRQSARR